MKKYCSADNFELIKGDCVEVMKELPSESVDMIFADPPYNLSNDGITCQAGKMVSVNKGGWDKSAGLENDHLFHLQWINECRRLLKKNGTIWISGTYHSIFSCGFALQKAGFHILNDIIWYKPNASPNLSGRYFTASHETLIWARRDKDGKHTFNYELMKGLFDAEDFFKKPEKQMRSVWSITPARMEEKKFGKHPTQKPEKLLNRIIVSCTNENDTILDPFNGSGTTGVAAIGLNRKYIGIEIEDEYLSLTQKRILDISNTPKLL